MEILLTLHDRLPEIAGQVCSSLLVQQYWCRDELIDGANVLFLKLGKETWHRFFIDAGVVFWSTVEAPACADDDGDHRYRLVDIGASEGLVGKQLRGVTTVDLAGGGELHLAFDNASTLVIRDQDDLSELVLVP